MSSLRVIHLTSIAQLRTVAASAWDDLWWRSDVALPTTRAELIAQWVEQFAPHAVFRATVVAAEERWIAALPLVGSRVGWTMPAGQLPSNSWSPCGELLLDPDADVDGALDLLLASAGCLPWQLLWMNETVPTAPRWQALLRAAERAGLQTTHHERYRVGRVAIGDDWESYQKHLRKGHRQNMNRVARRLDAAGTVHFERQACGDVADVAPWLQTIFAVEDHGWKGPAGSSVLGTPDMFRYFVRQAEQLAQWGQLEIATLRLDERVVAFLYGFRAKGVYFAHKIGYDPRFAAFSPGQLLFYRLLEQLHRAGDVHALDFMGPLTESLARWQPTTYGVGRIALALRPAGTAALYAYKTWWPWIRRLKGRLEPHAGAPGDVLPAGELINV